MDKTTNEDMEFETWMKAVNRWLRQHASVDADDLVDYSYYDAWEDGATPAEAAVEALENDHTIQPDEPGYYDYMSISDADPGL